MMEALSSSETSVLTRATRLNIPEDGTLHGHRRVNLKPYIVSQSVPTTKWNSFYTLVNDGNMPVCANSVGLIRGA
jgi:hypothetical protein